MAAASLGWLIAPRESAELAQQLIADTVSRHDVMPGALTLHADRGTFMRSKPVDSLLVDLDVAKSHSRPYTSDDNPYSESQFKTMKYRPDFPDRFGSIEDARSHCQAFFTWYNGQHRHSGDATPNRFKGVRPEAGQFHLLGAHGFVSRSDLTSAKPARFVATG